MLEQKNLKGNRIRVYIKNEESFFNLIESNMKKQGYELVETMKKKDRLKFHAGRIKNG